MSRERGALSVRRRILTRSRWGLPNRAVIEAPIMADVHYALKEDRAPLALGGRDARPFLQGMVTNDVDRVAVDRAIYAGFLTPQGRFLHDLFIAPSMHDPNPAAFLLDGEAARLDDLKRRLQLYKLRADVVITDARETLVVAVLWGRDAPSAVELSSDPGAARRFGGGIVFVDPRLPALGLRALLPKKMCGRSSRRRGSRRGLSSITSAGALSLACPKVVPICRWRRRSYWRTGSRSSTGSISRRAVISAKK